MQRGGVSKVFFFLLSKRTVKGEKVQPTVGEEWSTGIVIPPTPIWLGGIISLTFCIGFQCTHTQATI